MGGAKNRFSLPRELGEASLVNVARKATIEGVWMYQDGVFQDVTEQQTEVSATFVVRVTKQSPFVVYHIHPAREGVRGGYIDIIKEYKISAPSMEDFTSYTKLRGQFGERLTCKVADGWGVWSYALTREAIKEGLLDRLNDRIIFQWIFTAYRKFRYYTLRPKFEEQKGFQAALKEKGVLLRYDTIHDLYHKASPT